MRFPFEKNMEYLRARAYRERGQCNSFNGEIKCYYFSNTKLREIFESSVYFPSTPSKLKVQVFVLLFLVTLFISPSILPLWELHALSLYKPLLRASTCGNSTACLATKQLGSLLVSPSSLLHKSWTCGGSMLNTKHLEVSTKV